MNSDATIRQRKALHRRAYPEPVEQVDMPYARWAAGIAIALILSLTAAGLTP